MAVAAVIGVLVFATIRQTPPQQRPVAIAVGARTASRRRRLPRPARSRCPNDLGDYHRAPAAEPAPVGAAAWQADPDAEPVILRCGLERPDDFVVGAPLQVVDDVDWFRIGDEGRSTWITVDRPVYIALTLPDGSGPSPIQLISTAVAKAMPAIPVNPGPVR